MHKDKNGKVFASLTEVKNKTGDIFSVVDEYGEITLTSYNKARYKITKIEVSNFLDLEEKEEKPKATVIEKIKDTVTNIIAPVEKEVKTTVELKDEKKNTMLSDSVLKSLAKMLIWNRNSKQEKQFIKKAKLALQ